MATRDKKVKKSKGKAPVAIAETRQVLMHRAKERGIKNFRVLNRAELAQVLADDVTQEKADKVISRAVARWKSGWGAKKAKS